MKLGTRVRAPGRLCRRSVFDDGHTRKEWYRPDWATVPIVGLYMGSRTYQCGVLEWIGDEEGFRFVPDKWIKVALIVRDPRHNPVPVLYSEMEEAEG